MKGLVGKSMGIETLMTEPLAKINPLTQKFTQGPRLPRRRCAERETYMECVYFKG